MTKKRSIRSLAAPLIAASLALPDAARAAGGLEEDFLFDSLPIIAVSKKQETIRTTPGVVSVLTREDIDRLGVKSISEALAFVPGMMSYNSYFTEFNQFAIRGNVGGDHTSAKILVVMDDHPVFEPITGGVEINMVPLVDVERIEIVRGPASVQYGTNALTGVIKIITRRPGVKTAEGEARYQGGGYSFHQGQLFAGGGSADKAHWSASASSAYNHGPQIHVSPADRTLESGTAFSHQLWMRRLTGRATVGYKDFDATVRYWNENNPAKIGIIPSSALRVTDWDKSNLSADTSLVFKAGEKADVHVLSRFDKFNAVAYAPPNASNVVTFTDIRSNKIGGEVYANLSLAPNFDLLVGTMYDRYYHTKYANSGSVAAAVTIADYRISDTAGYVNGQLKLSDPLKLTLGTRYSENTLTGAHLDYQGGVLYDVNYNWTVKLLHGTSYRAPNVQELYFNSNPTAGNPRLVPEVLKGVDLVFLYSAPKMTGQLIAYWNRTVNMIKRVPNGVVFPPPPPGGTTQVQYFNTPGEQSQGVEWELKTLLGADSAAWVSGSHIFNPRELDNGATPGIEMLVIRNMADVGLHTDWLDKRLRLSGAIRYADHWGRAPHYWTTNASAHYKVFENAEVFVQATNIFDRDYKYAEFSRQRIPTVAARAPREVMGGFSLKF